jgi:hypothetical protein
MAPTPLHKALLMLGIRPSTRQDPPEAFKLQETHGNRLHLNILEALGNKPGVASVNRGTSTTLDKVAADTLWICLKPHQEVLVSSLGEHHSPDPLTMSSRWREGKSTPVSEGSMSPKFRFSTHSKSNNIGKTWLHKVLLKFSRIKNCRATLG